MDKKPEECEKYRRFVDERLEVDLANVTKRVNMIIEEIREYETLLTAVSKIKASGVKENLETQVSIGKDVFCEAVIERCDRVIVKLCDDIFAELTLERAEVKVHVATNKMRVAFTKSEWMAVTVLYRSDRVEELRRVVATLQAWRVRMGNSLHVAAEMSEVLLSAILADREAKTSDWLAAFNLRLLYSAAVIRFVNYVNEMCQRRKPSQLMSVRAAVSMMNVPAWVVQLRHEATHAHLPSLKLLREAACWCREWLWHNHWEKPIDEAMSGEQQNDASLPTLNDRILMLIGTFIKYRMQHPNDDLRPNMGNASDIFQQIEKTVVSNMSEFIEIFLLDGYLIMTDAQLKVAGFGEEKGDASGVWHVPTALQMFWRPVLSVLNRAKALPELLYQLIAALSTSHISEIRRRQLIGWADRMLDAFVHSQVLSETEWKRILRAMFAARENFTERHLEIISAKIASLSGKRRRSLEQLMSMSPIRAKKLRIETAEAAKSTNRMEMKTLADLYSLKQQSAPIGENATRTTPVDGWVRCEAMSWKGVPLGLTPHQTADTLMLIIDSETFIPRRHWQS
uniref:Protein LAS1 n=1 Tax=Ascaris suum TaxID=6253 RepID=F1KX10_ASCSU